MQRFFLIISGPTGVGKTDFVMQLADKLALESVPVVIINGDMGQMYRPLSIGTAKPSKAEQEKYPHWGFNIIDEPHDFTVMQYRDLIVGLLEKCWAENKLPIIVGGSGFYIKSILFSAQGKDAKQDDLSCLREDSNPLILSLSKDVRGPMVSQQDRLSARPLRQAQWERDGESWHQDLDLDEPTQLSPWEYLERIDPVRAREIHPHDSYRISKALALWKKTGILPSQQKPVFNPPGDFYFLFLTRDRQDLHERINRRTELMINQGWIAEVENLTPEWRRFLIQKKIIGYPEIIAFCEKDSKMHQVIADIQAKTRAYAKKQITFWRALKSQILQAPSEKNGEKKGVIEELNLTLISGNLYLNQLSLNLKKKYYELT